MRLKPTGVALLAGALALAAFLATLNEMHDWDAFHHLAFGREILRRGGFPTEDPFLFPLAGLPSGAPPSWLGSVAIYLSWRLLGDAGPLFLASAVTAVVFAVVLVDALEGEGAWLDAVVALVPVGLALAVARGRAVPRPEIFANLLLATTLYGLRRHLAGRSGLLVAFPFLLALWANLHQSVLAGLAAVATFVAANGLFLLGGSRLAPFRETSRWRPLVLPLVASAAGVLLAGAVGPSGFQPFASPVRYVLLWMGAGSRAPTEGGLPPGSDTDLLMKAGITELQPVHLGLLDPFTWLLALAAASFVLAGLVRRRLDARELLTCLAFGLLSVRAARFGAMAGIVLAPIAARNLRAGLGLASPRARRALSLGIPAAAVAVLATAWTVTLSRSSLRFGTGPGLQLPVRAVEVLRSAGIPARPFDTFHFGGYLEWMLGGKVFQDGRGGLRPDEARAAMLGPFSRETFLALDERYRFDALIIEYPELAPDLAAALAAEAPDEDWAADRSRWALVAFDDGGMLYLRRDGALAALAARGEYRFARPAVPPGVGTRDLAAAREEFERSLREAPRCATCRNALGYLYLREGRLGEAEAMFAGALAGAPLVRAQALFGAAQCALLRGDRAGAEGRLREVIEVVAAPSGPRRQLAALLADGGRPRDALREIEKNWRSGSPEVADLELAARFARQAGDEEKAREIERRLPNPTSWPPLR
jgi:tetratricopeptide (TPR) repeat protein